MQKIRVFLALVCVCALALSARAQDSSTTPSTTATTSSLPMRRNIIKINLISPIANSLHLGYERVLNDEMSFQFSAFVQDTENFLGDTGSGFGWFGELRFYVSERRKAPSGFFVAPYVGNYNYNFKGYEYSVSSGSSFSVERLPDFRSRIATGGIIVGGQWTFKRRVTLDMWGGPGYAFQLNPSKESYWSGGFPYSNSGFIGRGGVTLGFAF